MNISKTPFSIFIEHVTFSSWLRDIFPFLVRERLRGVATISKIYFIDKTKLGGLIARLTLRFLGRRLEKLEFRLVDIKDELGNSVGLKIYYDDMICVQKDILASEIFQRFQEKEDVDDVLLAFLTKQIAILSIDSATLWRALFLIRVVVKKMTETQAQNSKGILFLNQRLWWPQIKRHAQQYQLEIRECQNRSPTLKEILIQRLGPTKIRFLRNVYFDFKRNGLASFIFHNRPHRQAIPVSHEGLPKLAVEYYGQLNLDNAKLHSDLFFLNLSKLSGSDIVMTFNIPRDPVDEQKWAELAKYGITAIALDSRATKVSSVPVFYHWKKSTWVNPSKRAIASTSEEKWLNKQVANYQQERNYWIDLLQRYQIKVYLSWYKYTAAPTIIADALQNLGGITAIYQRAFEEFPSPEVTVVSNIVFGFSKEGADLERRSNSLIDYHVVIGYPGDYRFPLIQSQAKEIRRRLEKHGAKCVLAFFDENSHADSRWHAGHEFSQANYLFLLEKVLKEPWFGLVLKPKTFSTLHQRLGKVADVLSRTEKTGRCFIFKEGTIQSAYPPAIAALTADIAVHGHLCAATAGVESALCGVPTLLLDREGWSISKLYRLGKGRVVFTQWEDLWKACLDYWQAKDGVDGFGDWSPLLDEIDPFRDGRAAERMGTYLKWILDGFKSGLTKDVILADAAERFGKIWGYDKITELTPGVSKVYQNKMDVAIPAS